MVKDWCKAIAVVWVHFPLQRNAWLSGTAVWWVKWISICWSPYIILISILQKGKENLPLFWKAV